VSGPRLSAVLTAVDPAARWRVGVVTKRTYLEAEGRLTEAAEQVALVEAPRLADDGVALAEDSDLMLRKAQVDVVVRGHAYSHQGERQLRVGIRIGTSFARAIQVWGDRRVERDHDGVLRFSYPRPFERIPLGWERAYGGHDAAALKAHGDPTEELRKEAGVDLGPAFGLYAYPRNRVGRGYLVEITDEALASCLLPNLEDPDHPLTPDGLVYGNSLAWPDGPPPASTDWLPYSFFPRMTLLGFPSPMFDEERFPPSVFHEVRAGLIDAKALAEDAHVAAFYDLRGAQGSAPGMRAASVLPGDAVTLTNCHPRAQSWQFTLTVRPPLVMLQLPGKPEVMPEPVIRTVLIQPDEGRVCLVWVAEIPVDWPVTPDELATVRHAVIWPA
jgi:uncharacterized protein DUF2169